MARARGLAFWQPRAKSLALLNQEREKNYMHSGV
jgi:hypothetical protein